MMMILMVRKNRTELTKYSQNLYYSLVETLFEITKIIWIKNK